MKIRFTFLLLLYAIVAAAQRRPLPVSLSFFNNGTSLPGQGYAGTFSKTIHPGLVIGTYHTYRERKHTDLFQTLKLGYFYHHHAQQGIQLYTELGYRYRGGSGFYGEGTIGAGYLHSFSGVEQFTWKDGHYVKKTNWGRPQLMATAALSGGYDLQRSTGIPLRLFLQYQFWLQTPFVNKYVPLLPNSALHIGAVYQINRHQSQQN